MQKKSFFKTLGAVLILIPVVVGSYHVFKSSPESVSYESDVYQTDSAKFIYDLTYETEDGTIQNDQTILDHMYDIIDEAESFLLMDLFLFNDDYDRTSQKFPSVSHDLADRLIQKKQNNPEMDILLVTDPINSFYRTYTPDHFKAMEEVGIKVVQTDLKPLRDSNPLYSSLYRSYLQWFTPSTASYMKNVLRPQGPDVNIGSYIEMLNFKANHRKTVMSEKTALIASWNPHDGSGYHSNIAFTVQGDVLNDLHYSDSSVARWSGVEDQYIPDAATIESESTSEGTYQVQLVTEQKIKEHILSTIQSAQKNDQLKAGLFYLSDRDIIDELKRASQRGVNIQLILDINRDAFGAKKIGIPNKPVAAKLIDEENIDIRWYETHGEQYHAKFLVHEGQEDMTIIGGSANFTRRNLDDYNLETDLKVVGPHDSDLMQEVTAYYDRIWHNEGGHYTVDYTVHAENSWWKNIVYFIQERFGTSTF